MDLNRLEESAKAQHEALCKIGRAVRRHASQSSRVKNDKARSFGVMISTPLEIDKPSPCDSEQRFFVPSYKDEHLQHALGAGNPDYVTGLTETARNWEAVWGETLGRSNDPDDSDCLGPTPDQLPGLRFWCDGWCNAFLLKTGDDTFSMPEREEVDWDYRPLALMQPRDPAKPHLSVVMGDSEVASGAGEVLVSELEAAVEFSKRQLACGNFTNHHTKPIIIYTLMSETHSRITQANFNAKANKLEVRHSRILDLRGKQPTADAYLLLRWMMNRPVGETEY